MPPPCPSATNQPTNPNSLVWSHHQLGGSIATEEPWKPGDVGWWWAWWWVGHKWFLLNKKQNGWYLRLGHLSKNSFSYGVFANIGSFGQVPGRKLRTRTFRDRFRDRDTGALGDNTWAYLQYWWFSRNDWIYPLPPRMPQPSFAIIASWGVDPKQWPIDW